MKTYGLATSIPQQELGVFGWLNKTLTEAKAELEKARIAAIGAAKDSAQMYTYEAAKKYVDLAEESYKQALDVAGQLKDLKTPTAKVDAFNDIGKLNTQALQDAIGSQAISGLINNPQTDPDKKNLGTNRNPGSGITSPQAEVVLALRPGRPNMPTSDIVEKLQTAVSSLYGDTYKIVLTSGEEEPGHQVGAAVRHPEGYAVDFHLEIDGKAFSYTGNQSLYDDIALKMASDDANTNYGAGKEYMSGQSVHIDITPPDKLEPGQGHQWSSGAKAIAGELNEARKTGIYNGKTPEKPAGGSPADYDKIASEAVKEALESTETDKPSSTENIPTNKSLGQRAADAVKDGAEKIAKEIEKAKATLNGFLKDPLGTIGGWFKGGGAGGSPSTPRPGERDPLTPATSSSKINTKNPGTELYTVANAATPTGRETSTSSEYRFGGTITRTILYGEDGLPLTDISDNYAGMLSNTLSIDYLCDGSVDATKSFTLPYTAFDATQETSQVLISQYLPVTSYGSHCFFFTVDALNIITEANEGDNVSNKYRFIVSEGTDV